MPVVPYPSLRAGREGRFERKCTAPFRFALLAKGGRCRLRLDAGQKKAPTHSHHRAAGALRSSTCNSFKKLKFQFYYNISSQMSKKLF